MSILLYRNDAAVPDTANEPMPADTDRDTNKPAAVPACLNSPGDADRRDDLSSPAPVPVTEKAPSPAVINDSDRENVAAVPESVYDPDNDGIIRA